MAQQNFVKLAGQGRSFDATRPWSEEELNALISLEAHGVARTVAADYVRNGIMTVAQYEKAQSVGFAPKSLEDLRTDAIAMHQQMVRDALGEVTEVVVEPEAEVVVEPESVVVADEVVVEPEAEVVVETEEAVVEPKGKSSKKSDKK